MDLESILARPELLGTDWSIAVDSVDGARIAEVSPTRLLRTASVAKVFLLIAVANRIESGTLDQRMPVSRTAEAHVKDSGIWQHLEIDALPLTDVARLVGMASDNWATNVLLDIVGLDEVRVQSDAYALLGSMLLDRVRDRRGIDHPETLSVGCAADWVAIFAGILRGKIVTPELSSRVRDWLSAGLDLSMVAGAFGLDPLSHLEPDRGFELWNKTGTDAGVRADVGVITGPRGTYIYAVICNWDVESDLPRDSVLRAMRDVGRELRSGCS